MAFTDQTVDNYALGPCQSYWTGHQTHWIPALRSPKDPGYPGVPGLVTEHHENGVIVVELAGEQLRLWHHEPVRLATLVKRNASEVWYQERWSILRTKSMDGWYCFNVAPGDSWSEQDCVYWADSDKLYRQRTGSRGPLVVSAFTDCALSQ